MSRITSSFNKRWCTVPWPKMLAASEMDMLKRFWSLEKGFRVAVWPVMIACPHMPLLPVKMPKVWRLENCWPCVKQHEELFTQQTMTCHCAEQLCVATGFMWSLYEPGEWVMIWEVHLNQGSWIGRAKVINQERSTTVFRNNSGTLVRAAPAHIRPVSAVQAQLIPIEDKLQAVQRSPNHGPLNSNAINPNNTEIPISNLQNNQTTSNSPENHHRSASNASSERPDQEPEETTPMTISNPTTPDNPSDQNNLPEQSKLEPHEILVPDDTVDELMCDLLTCVDDANDELIGPFNDESVWRAELEFTQDQLESMCLDGSKPNEEELLMLATTAKRQRTEVKLSTLDSNERQEFEEAKAKEVQDWLQTGAVVRMFRHELPPKQILKCKRWYVWKPITESCDQKTNNGIVRKVKARLVVLGFQDPQLDTIPKDSPTLGRTSKMLIAQVLASMRWTLMSFDIQAAFLQGRTQENRVIAAEPFPEMISAMQLSQMRCAALWIRPTALLMHHSFGLWSWIRHFDRWISIPSPFDPCLYLLYKEGATEPSGILGVHLDDGICGGDSCFLSQIQKLEGRFPFGSKKSQNFALTGIEMSQNNDHSITMSQEKYITKIYPHSTTKRKPTWTSSHRRWTSGFTGFIWFLTECIRQYETKFVKPTQFPAERCQQSDHWNSHPRQPYPSRSKTPQKHINSYSTNSTGEKKISCFFRCIPESHTGMMIMATHADISKNHVCPVNPISWGCKKIQRVVTSTLLQKQHP